MTIKVVLKEKLSEIDDLMVKATINHFNERLKKYRGKLYRRLRVLTARWLMESPEIQSLLSDGKVNTLNAEFGLWYGSSDTRVNAIVNAIVESIVVTANPIRLQGRRWKGGLEISIQPSSFINLLSLNEAVVITEKDQPLAWLEWLLTRGDSPVIVGYDYAAAPGEGRSGGGVMEKGVMFRVDPRYSGTPSDNFITRALSGRDQELAKLVKNIIN